jgi:hypothetical protein
VVPVDIHDHPSPHTEVDCKYDQPFPALVPDLLTFRVEQLTEQEMMGPVEVFFDNHPMPLVVP